MTRTAPIAAPWEPRFTQRHNLVIAILLGTLPVFAPWMGEVGIVPQLFILAVFVILTGLPHGALDITLLQGAGVGPLGITAALFLYIGLAGLVVAGFEYFPTMALSLFLVVAWIHFGLGDTENLSGWHRLGECFARGGMAVAGPLLFHYDETLELFVILCGQSSEASLLIVTQFANTFICPVWLSVCLLMVCLRLRAAVSRSFSSQDRNDNLLAAWEIVFLTLLFWLWPPLAAFGVYFCFIHSVRHLVQIAKARQPHSYRQAARWLWRESWPVVGLTLILGAVLMWYWGGGLNLDALILRLLFVGLAALTMPHMLLTYWWHRRGKPAPGEFLTKFGSYP